MHRFAGLLLLLFSTIVGLGVLEGGLRWAAERRSVGFTGTADPSEEYVPDTLLAAWFRPNYSFPDGHGSFDSRGFRLNGHPRDQISPRPVAFLGGSTAYGWGANDPETIPTYLEQHLRTREPNLDVINAGFPGHTTLDAVLVYAAKVAQYQPRATVVLVGLNDLYYAADWNPDLRLYWQNSVFEAGLRARRVPELRPLVDDISSIALNNCYLCYYVGSAFSRAYDARKDPNLLRAGQFVGQQPLGEPNPRAMRLTAAAIRRLAERVRADGGCLLVAWQPVAGITSPAVTPDQQSALAQVEKKAPRWGEAAPLMYAQLREEARPIFESGLAAEVDVTRVFDDQTGQIYIGDGVHYNALGNRLIADGISRALPSACPPA